MKSKQATKHIIEQRTANRKNARRRKRHLFRLAARTRKIQSAKAVKEAQLAAMNKGD